MGTIQEHHAAAELRLGREVQRVSARFDALECQYRNRILALIGAAGYPIQAKRLILADRELGGVLGGLRVEHVERLCQDLFAQGQIDAEVCDEGLIVFANSAAEPPPLAFVDAVRIARGCKDYGGGYRGTPEFEVFQHGIQTVVNALTAATDRGLGDLQVRVLPDLGDESATVQTLAATERPIA
jgi:hypothetical protein